MGESRFVFCSVLSSSRRDRKAETYRFRLLFPLHVQPNHLEVLPGGLVAIADGLTRIVSGKAAGVKLIVHPQETA